MHRCIRSTTGRIHVSQVGSHHYSLVVARQDGIPFRQREFVFQRGFAMQNFLQLFSIHINHNLVTFAIS